jgi:hypothetical protein
MPTPHPFVPRPFLAAWLALATRKDIRAKLLPLQPPPPNSPIPPDSKTLDLFHFTTVQRTAFLALLGQLAANQAAVDALEVIATAWSNLKAALQTATIAYDPVYCPPDNQLSTISLNEMDPALAPAKSQGIGR